MAWRNFAGRRAGSFPTLAAGETPRNLMGFKDGTGNPSVDDRGADGQVRLGRDEKGRGGCKAGGMPVVRRIRMALEHWDRMTVAFQEQTIGRQKIFRRGAGRKK